MNREEFIASIIPEYEDIIQIWDDYNILISEYGKDNIYIDRDLCIEDNLYGILRDIKYYYTDQFLSELFDIFFTVDNKIDNLYDLFSDTSYIDIGRGNELVFNFDYFIKTVEKFLQNSNIAYIINKVDYNELINEFNSEYRIKFTLNYDKR